MPRIAPRLLRAARALHPHLASLLPVCRDLPSAQNELRWIQEHVHSDIQKHPRTTEQLNASRLVHRRARGEPLQYVLGSEFFGDLEIKCRPGVLIPRPETAASVTHLVHLVSAHFAQQSRPSVLRIVDMCTGTGCIPLLFQDEFYKRSTHRDVELEIRGYDISEEAIKLAYENLALQRQRSGNDSRSSTGKSKRAESLNDIEFLHHDVLASNAKKQLSGDAIANNSQAPRLEPKSGNAPFFEDEALASECDILISNPPYISPSGYRSTTARSVRQFEPKLALVPPSLCGEGSLHDVACEHQGDLFYPRLLDLAERLRARIMLFEVADFEQARRIAEMALKRFGLDATVEIWKDEPSRDVAQEHVVEGTVIRVIGEGNGRSVFISRADCAPLGY